VFAKSVNPHKSVTSNIHSHSTEICQACRPHDENNLHIWERKVLRKIFGPICVAGSWKRRTNEEVKQLYGKLDIVT
jgi:hypothetical protein